MKNWIKRHWLLTAFLLLGSVPVGLNYSGFCIPQGRWLSDEEKIRLAIMAVNSNGPNINYLPTQDWIKYGNYKPIRYLDVNDFIKKNPNCCKTVGSKGKPFVHPPFLWRILGDYGDVIEIRYTARITDERENSVNLEQFTEYPVIKNCGYVFTRPAI